MKLENLYIILGPPGSGKGTQGKLLAEVLHCPYVSMGQVLRNYSSSGTKLAEEIKMLVDAGKIIPDEMIRIVFHEVMMGLPENSHAFVLDGFPRDLNQAPILHQTVDSFGVVNKKIIFINVPEDKLIERLKIRGQTSDRADDNPEIFHTRFEEYRTRTVPLKEYFSKRGTLIDINGDQSIEATHQEIMDKLGIR